jgi:hypothetical protein
MENHLTPNDHEAENYFNLLSAFPMHRRRPLRTGRLHSAFQAEVEALSCLDARPPIKGFFGVAPTVRNGLFSPQRGGNRAGGPHLRDAILAIGPDLPRDPGFMKSKMTARRFAAVQRIVSYHNGAEPAARDVSG